MMWKSWQIVLMVVFGTVWLIFFILDCRRKAEVKKREEQKRQELKAEGYSDDEIKEIMQNRNHPIHKKYRNGGVK